MFRGTTAYKPFPIKPLSGVLNKGCAPAEIRAGDVRSRLNWEIDKNGKMRRMAGWQKLLSQANYNNQDLHDQLLPAQFYYGNNTPESAGADDVGAWPSSLCLQDLKTRTHGRERITFGREIVSTRGGRKLIVGTQSRLYELNENTGNYRLLCDGMGDTEYVDGGQTRWRCGVANDIVIAANSYDYVQSYKIGDRPQGCFMRASKDVTSLVDRQVYSAVDVCEFKGFILLANVKLGGVQYEDMMLWSDFMEPEHFIPGELYTIPDPFSGFIVEKQSSAGYQQLGGGHKIIRALPMRDVLNIYTDKAIVRGNVTGSKDNALNFGIMYSSTGKGLLAYPNTLVDAEDGHFYFGSDGIYYVSPFDTEPVLLDWLHLGTKFIFDEINKNCCHAPAGGYNPETGELWFSWPTGTSTVNSKSVCINIKQKFVTEVDHGFSCFFTFRSDNQMTMVDLLRDACACSGDDLGDYMEKEGLPLDVTCDSSPTAVITTETLVTADVTTEDWYADAIDDSLCAWLGDMKASDYCQQCNQDRLFVAASTTDYCLKQLGGAWGREMCLNAATGAGAVVGTFSYRSFVGSYDSLGYHSTLTLGPLSLGLPYEDKVVSYFEMIAEALELTGIKAYVSIKIGSSHVPLDPMDSGCSIRWRTAKNHEIKCLQTRSGVEYAEDKLAPAWGFEGPLHIQARYFYVEIKVGQLSDSGDVTSALVPGTGGVIAPSEFILQARRL